MKKGKVFYGWWLVLAGAVVLAILGPASVAVANIFQPLVTNEFGISNSQFAISNSLVLGMGIFLSPFVSQKLASKSFRGFFTLGVLVYGLAYMAYGFAQNIYMFYFLSLFVGFGYLTTTVIPVSIVVNNWFVKKRGLALSLALSGLGVGGVVFSQLVTWLIETAGWRQTYIVYGAIMLIIALPVVWFVFKLSPEEMGMKAYGAEDIDRIAKSNQAEEGNQEQIQGVQMPVEQTMTKPFFLLLVAGAVIVGIINNGGLGQFPPYLYNLHGPAVGATIVSVYSGVGIIGKIVLGNLTDRFGTIVSTLYSASLLFLTYLVMMFGGNVVFAFVAAALFGMGNAVGTVSPALITSAIYSTDNYPKAYGYVQSGIRLGMTLGSLVAASIADVTGSYSFSWGVLAIAALLMAASWVSSYKNAQKYVKHGNE